MALLRFSQRSFCNWTPKSYETDEIFQAIAVNPGDLVGGAIMDVRTVFDGSGADATLEVGDGVTSAGFMTTTNTGATTAGLKQGTGAYLTEVPGHLYTVADTIDINCITDSSNLGSAGTVDIYVYVALANQR